MTKQRGGISLKPIPPRCVGLDGAPGFSFARVVALYQTSANQRCGFAGWPEALNASNQSVNQPALPCY
ncbi:hypothetical protein [Paraburkholderia bonniea]|uniref:hypothetical protein n=1 Tax=Paraburkholderia bonniea TaxID=2152891 RepID=UPI001292493B|nr:hypothetical protein [Paraburkholderia bonniea]